MSTRMGFYEVGISWLVDSVWRTRFRSFSCAASVEFESRRLAVACFLGVRDCWEGVYKTSEGDFVLHFESFNAMRNAVYPFSFNWEALISFSLSVKCNSREHLMQPIDLFLDRKRGKYFASPIGLWNHHENKDWNFSGACGGTPTHESLNHNSNK